MSNTVSLPSVVRRLLLLTLVILGLSCAEETSSAAPVHIESVGQALTVPANFTDQFIANVSNATAMEFAPDGRLFICQQGGALRVVKNGTLLSSPFLTVSTDSVGERGLLGVTFDPNFATNQFVYVYYTVPSTPRRNRISRFQANGDVAVSGSETVIMELDDLSSATNHNGGAIHFGPDGKLYVAVGDNANSANAQSFSTRHGKILRINADGTIPTDNPFFASTTGNNRAIWALGLRNPFTFAFQRGATRMFINDVGQNTWEEINDGIAGSNYGWPTTEGATTDPRFRSPLLSYAHGSTATTGCSITGGAFYTPATVLFPSSYVGKYFFADYCTSWIRVFDPATGSSSGFGTGGSSLVDLKVSADGYLYYLGRSSVGRVGYASTGQAPTITSQPQNRTVAVGQSATFSVGATGTQPLSYRWQRGTTDIPGATGQSYTFTPTATDNGATFRVIITNSFGSVTSASATLTVTSNRPPTASISSPAVNSTYAGGDTITFSGGATDPEQGTLPASALSWLIVFHHDTHTHPFAGPFNGVASGSFVIPRTGHTETNVWYRVQLTATDASGLSSTTFVDVRPRLANLTFQTNPTGLQVTLDGQPRAAPFTTASVVGVTRTLGVVSPQTLNGVTYQFASWSQGGAATQNVNTPAANTTYTATFTPVASGGGLRGEYFDNDDFTAPALTRTDSTVDFDWGSGSPSASIGPDNFSVRWTGTIRPRFTQAYTFYTQSDDGIRLWINNVQIINNWTDHAPTENSGTTAILTAGQEYPVRLEFYERGGGAVAKLLWSSSSQAKEIVPSSQLTPSSTPSADQGLKGEYFSGSTLSSLLLTRVDRGVNFDWGAGSPDPAVPVNGFSARWTGTVTPLFSQSYTFYTTSDDGIRLWVNNVQVINNWTDHARTENTGTPITLTAGQAYPIRLEYYENGGEANVSLSWSSSSQTKQLVPAEQLRAAP